MKSKTGLDKKVAFIFDGTPAGSQPTPSAPAGNTAPASGEFQPPASTYGPQPVPVTGSSKTLPAKSAKGGTKPVKSVSTGSGKKGKTDPKQQKMLVMIGILSVVLVGVLYFVLSGPAAPPKKAAANTTAPAEPVAASTAEPWKRPEPWPQEVRNPMKFGVQTAGTETVQTECVVRGIVYSQTRPSAIVGEQIVFVGDIINGMKIIAIEKESVKFEKDGKQWTQQVQR